MSSPFRLQGEEAQRELELPGLGRGPIDKAGTAQADRPENGAVPGAGGRPAEEGIPRAGSGCCLWPRAEPVLWLSAPGWEAGREELTSRGAGQQTCALALRGGCRVHSFPRDPPALTTHPRFSEHPPWIRPGAWRKEQDSVQLQAGPSTAPRITDAQATQGHAGPRRDPRSAGKGIPRRRPG